MKMTWHETEALYRRYATVDEAMMIESGARLQALHAGHADKLATNAAPVPLRRAGD